MKLKLNRVIFFLFLFLVNYIYSINSSIGCVVSVYNRPEFLMQTLCSLKKIDLDPQLFLHIVIIDDHSADYKVIELIREFDLDKPNIQVHKVFFKKNQGIANVLNFGFRFLKKKCNVSFYTNLDSDVLLKPNWLNELISLQKKIYNSSLSEYNFFTAYNSRLHEVRHDAGFCLEKKTFGGINIFFHKNCLNLVLTSLKKGLGWDWELVSLIEMKQGKIYCTKPSYLQHIGIYGLHSQNGIVKGSSDLVDIADDFCTKD